MEITTVGLDIAKRVFQLHGVDAAGKAVLRRQLQRSEVLAFFKALPPCLVGIEACGTAHYWAREIRELGHEVRLMPPSYVAAYVKRGKTDAADAAAICEAVTRPTMRFVPIKRLALSLSSCNIPVYRQPAVILIDQLKEIYIDAVLEPVETANWFPKIYRKDYTIAINGTESGVDDPDQQFYETLSVGRCATTPVIAIRRLTS